MGGGGVSPAASHKHGVEPKSTKDIRKSQPESRALKTRP